MNNDPSLPVRVGKEAEKPKIYRDFGPPLIEEDPRMQRRRWITLLGYNRNIVSHSDPQSILRRSRVTYILIGTFIFVDVVLAAAYIALF